MKTILFPELIRLANDSFTEYENRCLSSLISIKLSDLLMSDSYILRTEQERLVSSLIKQLIDEYFSDIQKVIFEEFCRTMVFDFCKMKDYATRSSLHGIDLELDKDEVHYLIHVNGDTKWGNSSQIIYMVDAFKKAQSILHASNAKSQIRFVNGCCYGIENKPDKGDYIKLCGQQFWEFISGNNQLYIEIIEPLGYRAKERNQEFLEEYSRLINLFTQEFMNNFCMDGRINWEKLVRFNSENKTA